MSTNPDHINQLAAIIREVDRGLFTHELAKAIPDHPGSAWQPPAALVQPEVGNVGTLEQQTRAFLRLTGYTDADSWDIGHLAYGLRNVANLIARSPFTLAQPEEEGPGEQEIDGFIHQWWEAFGKGYLPNSSDKALVTAALARWARLAAPPAPEVIEAVGNCARIELVVALHTLASQFENETAAFTGDDLRAVQGHVKHARKIAAKHNQNGPGCAPPALPANYIDPEHQGEALELLQTFYQACSAEGGTADEIHLRGLRAVLAARPPTPPAREVGEVGLLVDRLNQVAGDFDFLCNKIVNGECRTLACLRRGGYDGELSRARGIKPPDPLVATCPALEKAGAMRRAATLLQQQQHLLGLAGAELDRMMEQQAAPAPAAVPVAVSERLPDSRPESGGGDCDAEGRCWVLMPRSATPNPNWTLLWMGHLGPCYSHWLPASAIPAPSNYIRDKKSRLLPHAGEVEA